MLTEYAAGLLGKQEVYARERHYTSTAMGHDNHKVVWKHSKGTSNFMVNLSRQQCSCKFPQVYRIICSHGIYVEDKLGRRRTPEALLAFRARWIAKQFWAENYIRAYENALAFTPPMGTGDMARYSRRNGERQVRRPVMPKKKKGKLCVNVSLLVVDSPCD